MPKYFLYARKSTDEDSGKQIHSIEDQISLVTEYCQKENIEVEQVFTESQTAKIPGRPIFDQMLNQLKEREVTGIVSWHPDRLARNSVDGGKIIYLLDQGILQYLKFPTFWFENTTQGKFMLSLSFSQAKYYVDSLSENVTRGMTQKAKRGEFPGKAHFGYLNDRNTKKIVLDPVTAPIVKQGLINFSKGNLSIGILSEWLHERGVNNRRGHKLWNSQTHEMLINPFYYGAFIWKGELYPGNHQPLITKKVFDQNQTILKNIPHGKFKRNQKEFVFKGLIKCGQCHHQLTAENHTKVYKRSGTSQTFTYYRCTKADRKIKCRQRYINQPDLVKQVNQYINSFIWPKDLIDKALTTISELKQAELKSTLHQLHQAKNQLDEINQQINRLIDLRLKGILTDNELLTKKNELTAKKLTLKSQSGQKYLNQNNSFEPIEIMFKNLSVAKKIRDDDQNLIRKAEWLKMTASNLFLEDKILKITQEKPWARLSPRPLGRDLVSQAGFELNGWFGKIGK